MHTDDSLGERRKDVRTRISVPTLVVRRAAVEKVEMLDASFRGLFIRTTQPPPERQLVKLRLSLPTRELEAHAVVVRLFVDAHGHTGVGLRFFALNGQDRTDWESFLSGAVRRSHAA